MIKVNIHAAKARLSKLIKKALLGEEVIIARDNKPIIKLVPIVKSTSTRQIGLSKGLVQMSDDFNGPLDDFKDYHKLTKTKHNIADLLAMDVDIEFEPKKLNIWVQSKK